MEIARLPGSFGGAEVTGLVAFIYLSRAPIGISKVLFREALGCVFLALPCCFFLCFSSQSSTVSGTPNLAIVSGTHARSG